MKHYEPIDLADFGLIDFKSGTPHCKKHGAMNKINKLEDGGGYWRCVVSVSRQNENCCRAGCREIRLGGFYTMDGKPDLWKIAYYPLTECGRTGEIYEEPRALVEKPIIGGTDFREIPLRYLKRNG